MPGSKSEIPRIGSKRQVYYKKARQTSGGLTKKGLFKNEKTGKIVSRKKHLLAKHHSNLPELIRKS